MNSEKMCFILAGVFVLMAALIYSVNFFNLVTQQMIAQTPLFVKFDYCIIGFLLGFAACLLADGCDEIIKARLKRGSK